VATWTVSDDAVAFRAAAGPFLAERRVELTTVHGVLETLTQRGAAAFGDVAPRFAWCRSGPGRGSVPARAPDDGANGAGEVVAVALRTPPYALVVSDLPDGTAAGLASAWGDEPLEAVTGPEPAVTALAAARGRRAKVVRRERLHRLGALAAITGVEGHARVAAGEEDRGLVHRWWSAFGAEAVPGDPPPRGARVDGAIGEGAVVLWVVDGEPVSFACARRASPGCTRIGPVYTPPGMRGRGFAGAVVTATAARARGAGADEVLLFSDLANPTAGELYARLGFAPVLDVVEADLE